MDRLGGEVAAQMAAADRHRAEALAASQRTAAVAVHLQRLRVRYDSVVANPVTVADTIILTQDSVIAGQDTVIRTLRLEADKLRAGALLLTLQRDLLQAERDSLLTLVRRAPVVQVAAPRPRTGWVAVGAFAVGFLVGVL